ncbi:peptidoglycan-binding protein [Notoacmeibacter sp. MSK16QG-6]|uniref:peptidoglycan-binding protein n=1 Tax=Notoacmeibacter sp. MSK16QG-6 TaxID=2957982 RepID=UPI00209E1580|nr:peptidoglycan-binding protein [Notoacmeibacter sp. MSK16QG-6]MCP1198629.1 peptidoglycan-binding protein [Notoacmeibacter sp. MSK16QG-6]
METRRDPFDPANVGRTRRNPSTLGHLSEKLSAIENRLGMGEIRPANSPFARSKTASDLDQLREQLRDELRRTINEEFHALRQRLGSVLDDVDAGRTQDVSTELARLSKAVADLSSFGESQGVDTLHNEMGEMKRRLDELAREETLREASSRWDQLDKRWSHFERQMNRDAESRGASEKTLSRLQQRIETIGDNVSNLPQSHSIGAMQDDIRSLIETVQKRAGNGLSQSALDTIDARLDELSRALVSAQSRPAEFDTGPLERIEARLSTLAKQVEPPQTIGPEAAEIAKRMEALTERVETLAGRSEAADSAIERIAHQLGTLTEHLEKAPPPVDLSPILSAVESRIETVVTSLERSHRDARDHSEAMFRELDAKFEKTSRATPASFANETTERALGEIEERLSRITDRMNSEAEHSEAERQSLLNILDERFNALSDRMHESISDVSSKGNESFDALQNRLSALSDQVESGAGGAASAAHSEAIANLEHQIAELSAYLSGSEGRNDAVADLAPRLSEIEQGLQRSQDEMMEAARQAVENTLRTMQADNPGSAEAMSSLGNDLRTLEELSRRTENRNARTFEAIHETMLKIVDRLAVIEEGSLGFAATGQSPESQSMAEQAGIPATERMAFDAAHTPPLGETALATIEALGPHTDGSVDPADDEAFLREFVQAEGEEPALPTEMEQPLPPEPDTPDEPMEPGSGAPDLDAVIGKIQAERNEPAVDNAYPSHTRNAKADFVAAARRAAQAAAADAENEPSGDGSNTRSRRGVASRVKLPLILIALVAILLFGGWQLFNTFYARQMPVAPIEPAVTAPEPVEDTAAAAGDASAEAEDALVNGTAAPAAGEVDPAPEAEPMDEPVSRANDTEQPLAGDTAADADAAVVTDTPAIESGDAAAIDERSISFGNAALQKAVAEGEPAAWHEVGARYAEGRGVERDMETAADWFTASAEAGYVPAEYRTALAYEKAMGVERDAQTALAWYQKAADAGNASAMHNLGVLFAQGAVGAPDNQQARKWFMDAAEFGIRDSQFNLGILNARGIGAPQDLVQSYKWFALAAKNGDTDAADKRDEVAQALRPEQLERARGIVELWKPKALDPAVNEHLPDPAWLDAKKDDTTASVDMKKAILNIQGILNNHGYDAGRPDGVMGEKTKAAIRAFQKDKGLAVTGAIDENLVQALLAANIAKPVDAEAAAAN